MDIDCLFNISLFCEVDNLIKLVSLNSHTKTLLNSYLWKLLCEREYKDSYHKINKNTFKEKYIICHYMTNLEEVLNAIIPLDELYEKTEIRFTFCRLTPTPIPYSLKQLPNLRKLKWNFALLKNLPPVLFQLKNLELLNLERNILNYISTDITQLHNLSYLNLSTNELELIPTEFGKLHNLIHLNISYNKLKTIPTELGKLNNIQSLYVNNNELINIPSEFGKLSKLKELCLDNNHLTTIPTEIIQLFNMNLQLSNTNLRVSIYNNNLKYTVDPQTLRIQIIT